jgi:hypothetical protein
MTTNDEADIDLVGDSRRAPTIGLAVAGGMLAWMFWFGALSVDDGTTWWSLPSGVNWVSLLAAVGSLVSAGAVAIARPNQSPPREAALFTLASATCGAALCVACWILTRSDPRPLRVEGSFPLALTALVCDAGAALWLWRTGVAQQRRAAQRLAVVDQTQAKE